MPAELDFREARMRIADCKHEFCWQTQPQDGTLQFLYLPNRSEFGSAWL